MCVHVLKQTCAQRKGAVPLAAEEAVDAVQTQLPFVAVVAGALAVSATSPVTVAHSISVTRSLGASHAIFDEDDQTDGFRQVLQTTATLVQFPGKRYRCSPAQTFPLDNTL